MTKPTRPRRPLIEAIEPRLLFSATADIAVFDDGSHYADGLMHAANNADLEQIYFHTDNNILNTHNSDAGSAQSNTTTNAQTHNLVFIDTSVKDYKTLVNDILKQPDNKNIELIYLSPDQDGIQQITNALKNYTHVTSIHIISHGAEDTLEIGNQDITHANINDYAAQLNTWKASLDKDADILLYGCDIAGNAAGLQLLDKIHQLTGADVAASTNATGAKNLQGDWVLESAAGKIETQTLLNNQQDIAWSNTLVNHAPTVANVLINQTVNLNSPLSYQFASNTFNDVDGNTLTYTATLQNGSSLPSWLSFNAATRTFSGTPTNIADFKNITVRVEADDGNGATIYDDFIITVSHKVEAETYTSNYDVGTEATSDTGGGLDVAYIDPGNWFKFETSAGKQLTAYSGTYTIDWRVASGNGVGGQLYFKNDPFNEVYDHFTIPDTGGWQSWTTITRTVNVTQRDDYVIYSPDGGFNVNWFTLTPNDTPTVSHRLADQIATENAAFSYQFIGQNSANNIFEDSDTLTYSATLTSGAALPAWLTFNSATRTFSGTPTSGDLGAALQVRVTATDTYGATIYDDFAITLNSAANDAPVNTVPSSTNTNEDTPIILNQGAGLTGTYYNNTTLTGPAAGTRTDYTIDYYWGMGAPGVAGVGTDNFSVRWNGDLHITETGIYNFKTFSDDGVRVYIDGNLVIDNWTGHALTADTSPDITLTAGRNYSVTIEYFDGIEDSEIKLHWKTPSSGGFAFVPSGMSNGHDAGFYRGNLISVTDIDAGNNDIEVTLAVTGGTLTLPEIANLSFTAGDGTADTTMTFRGTVANINSALAFLTYNPSSNFSGVAQVSMTTNDLGNSGTGGAKSDTDLFNITVNNVNNDPPSGTDKTITTNEDTAYTLTTADFGFSDTTDSPANVLAAVKITALPAAGTLKLNGVNVTLNQVVSAANINSGLLVFTPTTNANGNSYANFAFQVQDDGGTANGGVDLDPTPNTITFNVTSVNDAPAGTDKTITTNEDTAYALTTADFGFSDTSDSPANALTAVKITALPTVGTLKLNGVNVTLNQVVSAANINSGLLVFTPASNANGSSYANFAFKVQDDGGTANGGVDLDPTANTITFNVTTVNDAPSGTDKTITTNEDTAYTLTTADFGFSDTSDSPANTLTAVKITALPAAGTLKLNGVDVTLNQVVSAANINSGLLVFAPTSNANGISYANFAFKVQDNGGTANGGIDLDPTANTITFNVTAINDAPTLPNPLIDQNATEDSPFSYQFAANTFNDVDVGDTLTYSALLNGGGALPAWLTFNAATRTFSGTPLNANVGVLTINVTANDGHSGSLADTFTITIANTNDAPTVANAIPDRNATENSAFSFQFAANSFSDVDVGDTLTYTSQLNGGGALPAWLSFNAATRTFSGTPTNGDIGTISIDVTANDGHGTNVTDTFNIVINAGANNLPTVANAIPNQNATEDSAFNFQFASNTFNDVDVGNTLTYSAQLTGDIDLPTWLNFDAATRTFSGTPTNAEVGTLNIDVTADDGHGGTVTDTFTLTIANTNDAPTVAHTISNQNATEDSAFSFQFPANIFNDVDVGDTLTYSATLNSGAVLPAWLSFNQATRTFSGTPDDGDVGTITLKVIASDGNGGSTFTTFDVTVVNVNEAPSLANPFVDQNATEDSLFTYTFNTNVFSDPDIGDTLTYTATLGSGAALPSWLTIDSATRTFSGTPTNSDVGTIAVKLIATDSGGLTAEHTFNLTIANSNDAPTVINAIPDQNATEDAAFNFQFASNTFNDIDVGDTLTYSAQLNGGGALPAWLTFNAGTRTFSGTPTNAFVGTVNIDVIANDGHGGTITNTFAIIVANTNDAPTVANAIPNQNVTEDSAFTLQFASNTFNDVDIGDTLVYNAQLNGGGALPAWLNFNASTRTFSGTPTNADVGTITIDVTAFDGNGGSITDTFTITTANTNDAPAVANPIPNQNATQGSAFNFQFASNSFNDVDLGDTLTYSAQLNGGGALPAWLTFNAATRTFSGTPANSNVGTINIDVTASDGHGGTITDTFALIIANINDAPTVANPIPDQNATQGSAFNFQFATNSFNDIDLGDTLTYSAQLNGGGALPAWLNFNASTRTFSGTPSNSNIGTINIDVTASDGHGGIITDTFALAVTAYVNNAPTVANTIPDQNATQGSTFNFQFASNSFNDVDLGDTLTYSAQLNGGGALPAWLNFNASTRTFSGTPVNGDVGKINIDVTANDGHGGTITDTFALNIANINDTPTVANPIPDQNATQSSAFNFQFASNSFKDIDLGDSLIYSAQLNGGDALPAWLNFNASTRTFSGTPANSDVGEINIDVIANDGHGGTITDTFALTIANINDVPTAANTIPDQNAIQGSTFNFQFASNSFNDIDLGDTLTYSAQLNGGGTLPAWLTFNASTRTFSGIPANGDVDKINIDVIANDGHGGTITDTFALTIANINDAPTVANAIPDQNAIQGSTFNFQLASNSFNDIDIGDTLTYSAQLNSGGALPAWLTFDSSTRTFSGTPTNGDVGKINIDVTANDGHGGTITDTFALNIANINDAPTVANKVNNQLAYENKNFSFAVPDNIFNDIDKEDVLHYSAKSTGETQLPTWLHFDSNTKTFSGTPNGNDTGTLSIDLTATDTDGKTATTSFTIEVNHVNQAPTTSGIADVNAPENTKETSIDLHSAFADREDKDSELHFTVIQNSNTSLVTNAVIDTQTGKLNLTYAANQFGTSLLTIRATDTQGLSVETSFHVNIAFVNNPPETTGINNIQVEAGTAKSTLDLSNAFNDIEDGKNLTYKIINNTNPSLTESITFDSQTHTATVAYTPNQAGQTNITLRAADTNGGFVDTTFTIVVLEQNILPPAGKDIFSPPDAAGINAPTNNSNNSLNDNTTQNITTNSESTTTNTHTKTSKQTVASSHIDTSIMDNIADDVNHHLADIASDPTRPANNTQSISETDAFDRNRYDRIIQKDISAQKLLNQLSTHTLISNLIMPGQGFTNEDATEFTAQVRRMHQEMENAITEEQEQKAIYTGVTLSVTTGILIWSLRASSLLLTLFSMMPLWRGVDPLPILEEVEKRKKELEDQRKDKKAEDKNTKEVGYLFDNNSSNNKKE